MTNKHTPAPWSFNKYMSQVEAFEPNGNRSLQVKINCHEDDYEANARLIAAAPELLDSLENIIIALGMGWDLDGICEKALTVIKKANGE